MEIVYFLSNIWWLVVFSSPPGVFSGVAYDRAITSLGSEFLIITLLTLVVIAIMAFAYRNLAYVSLITGPIIFMYFGVVSLVGQTIAFNAFPLICVALVGFYRLLVFTYHRD